jgi:carbonic anhydrase
MNKLRIAFTICVASFFLIGSALSAVHGTDNKRSPDSALQLILKGNLRFVKGLAVHPHQSAKYRINTAKEGQKPIAAVLGCSDSRVPPEIIFDGGIGDIFTVRIAGNIACKETIGSIEYAVEHLGVRLILVLGHTKCGAVTTVADNEKVTGNLTAITDEIKKAVNNTRTAHKDFAGDKLILASVKANVGQSIEKIISSSGLLKRHLQAGDIKISGALYDIETGIVTMLK